MKLLQRLGALLTALLLVLLLVPAVPGEAADAGLSLTVLFTHDTHDHFTPDAADVGGYTRLATLLARERAAAQAQGQTVVTLGAGDFSMGSFIQTTFSTDAPELRALGYMGYDVTTFGNHEYDYRPQGLADMLKAARDSGDPLPAIVQANYKTPKDPAAQVEVDAMRDFPVTDYTVLRRDGLTIAVFGVMGVDSDECSPMSGMTLEPLIDASRRVVADIKAKEDPDFIICLSHSGTENGGGEDYELAKAVPDIDLIISGHTHTTLTQPLQPGRGFVVSCGPYTQNLGKITLTKKDGVTAAADYRLIPIDSSVPADPGMTEQVKRFQNRVNETYLSDYELEYDEVLTHCVSDFDVPHTGDLIGAAYIDTVQKVEGDSYVPIAFAVAPDGVIRDVVRRGDVTTDNAFNILSLGVGADGTPGYPLVSIYVTGSDLKNVFEVDATISSIMSAATLYGGGAHWTCNPHRMFLDRVTRYSLADGVPVQPDKLYRVVADLYSGQMLATVKSKSFGLLSIIPRDAQGNEIADFEDCIIHDGRGNEVKAWYALAAYLKTQDTLDPAAVLPSKEVRAVWYPWELLFPMGLPTFLVLLVLALVVLAVVLPVRAVVRRRRRRKT